MMHVTYSDKSLLLGDTTATLLLEYAAILGSHAKADTVSVHAVSSDGDDVDAVFLLGEGAPIMAETATTKMAEPENSEADAYMREKMQVIERPPYAEGLPKGEIYPDDYSEFNRE